MQFAQLHCNEALKASLAGMVDSGKMGHALLFVEEQGMGAIAYALALSQYINCKDRSKGRHSKDFRYYPVNHYGHDRSVNII